MTAASTTEAIRPKDFLAHRPAAVRRGARHPRHRPRVRARPRRCPTSASGSRRRDPAASSPASSAAGRARHAPRGIRLRRRQRHRLRPRLHGARGGRQRRAQPRLGAGLAGDVRDPSLGLGGAEAAVAAADGRRRGDRLLRPDRARRRAPTRRRCAPAPAATAPTGSLHGQKMWITNGSVADVAVVWARTDDGVRGFLVPSGTKGFTTQDIHHKLSLRASITSELLLDDVRLPADAMLPEATSLRGAAVVPERGPLRDRLGRGRRRPRLLRGGARLRHASASQFGRPIAAVPAPAAEARRRWRSRSTAATLLALHLGRLKDEGRLRARAGQHGQARQRQRRARGRPDRPPGARRQRRSRSSIR